MSAFLKVPTRLHYGLLLMSYLAENYSSKKPLALRTVAKRTRISEGYLEQIAALLKKKGLLIAQKGPGGGYLLKKNPQNLKAKEVVEALTGPLWIIDCLKSSDSSCIAGDKFEHRCPSKNFFKLFQKSISVALSTILLSQIL